MLCTTISSPSLQLGHLSSLCTYLEDIDIVRTFRTCKFLYINEYPKLSLTGHYSIKHLEDEKSIIPKISNFIFDVDKDFSKYKHATSMVAKTIIWEKLVENISSYPKLKFIYLCANQIEDVGASFLVEYLKVNSTLTYIDLHWNQITNVGAIALAEALKVNSSLTSIVLTRNQIGDVGTTAIAEALKINSTLTSIYLQDNQIKSIGDTAIAEALKNDSNVRCLY